MRRHWQYFWLAALGWLLVSGCDGPPQVHSLSGYTMGTEWSVRLVARPGAGELGGVRQEIDAALETVNAQMSTYRESSDISRFNRLSPGERIELPAEFGKVLLAALEMADATDGAYDPTVGPLVNLWGFGPDGRRTRAPAEEEIDAARSRVGWQQLEVITREGTIELVQPGGVYLDLSSIAKGFAVDLIAERLDALGFDAYLIDIGGDMRMRGHRPDGRGWRIGIERPVPEMRAVHSVIAPGDRAVATSGSYRNFYIDDAKERSHTIDPRSGHPVPPELLSVTVLDDSAMVADALATAIMVLGPQDGYAFARARELPVLLMVLEDDMINERMTPAFAPFLAEEPR
ncbi:MAG: FAD:protein FMN transferase [Gammaproteobacteria bacterium]|nr:FAD:protein FMN transferase [Gammaproteobacteria bacterium]